MKLKMFMLVATALIITGCSKSPEVVDVSQKPTDTKEVVVSDSNKNSGVTAVDNEIESVSKVENKKDEQLEDLYVPHRYVDENGFTYDRVKIPNKYGEIVEVKLPVIFFDFDKYELGSTMQNLLNDLSNEIRNGNLDGKFLRVDGHCDEWGTDEYNMALGQKRSSSVKSFLSTTGVVESNLNIISFGETKPLCSDHNKECWKQNRRVEFKVLP